MYSEYKTYQIPIKTIDSTRKLSFSGLNKFDSLKNKTLIISVNNKDDLIL